MKQFNVMQNVGKVRYLINHHDGVKTHKDGSAFFDITICRNKRALETKCNALRAAGYVER